MRSLIAALCLLPSALWADPSKLIAERGLTGARAELLARDALTPDDQLALGGIIFLQAVEHAYQERWRVGMTSGDVPMPVLRGDLPPNPAPEALEAGIVNDIFERFLSDMAEADAVLAAIPAEADPAFALSLPDLWFDVTGDGMRQPEEGFSQLALPALMPDWQIRRMERELAENPDTPDPRTATIRFDAADLHWLRAYTQVLSGASELILAFDPEPEIAKVLATHQAIAAQTGGVDGLDPATRQAIEDMIRAENPDYTEDQIAAETARVAADVSQMGARDRQFETFADILAIIIETLRHDPDPARLQAAQAHFLAMVAHNRTFWTELAQETDNDREWIPNRSQTAALGFEMPGETGEAWMAVLGDAEKLLKGELLIPFWRFAPGHGINLQAWLDDPAPVSLVGWVQGADALPYTEQGDVMTDANWRAFTNLVQGQSGLFVILLN